MDPGHIDERLQTPFSKIPGERINRVTGNQNSLELPGQAPTMRKHRTFSRLRSESELF